MTTVYLTIFLLFVVSRIDGGWIKTKRELKGCQSCLHMDFEVLNVPAIYKTAIESALRGMEMIDNDCVSGTSRVQTCDAPYFPDSLVDRCHSATITITAQGVGFLPEAKMIVTMVIRGCGRVEPSTENKCGGLELLDEEDRQNIQGMLSSAQTQWNSVVLDGDICIEDLKSLY